MIFESITQCLSCYLSYNKTVQTGQNNLLDTRVAGTIHTVQFEVLGIEYEQARNQHQNSLQKGKYNRLEDLAQTSFIIDFKWH